MIAPTGVIMPLRRTGAWSAAGHRALIVDTLMALSRSGG
jgi:hypothetical protein